MGTLTVLLLIWLLTAAACK